MTNNRLGWAVLGGGCNDDGEQQQQQQQQPGFWTLDMRVDIIIHEWMPDWLDACHDSSNWFE